MIYFVELDHGHGEISTLALLSHDQKMDFDKLRNEYFHGYCYYPKYQQVEEFTEWLINEKGFRKLTVDEYEHFRFQY